MMTWQLCQTGESESESDNLNLSLCHLSFRHFTIFEISESLCISQENSLTVTVVDCD